MVNVILVRLIEFDFQWVGKFGEVPVVTKSAKIVSPSFTCMTREPSSMTALEAPTTASCKSLCQVSSGHMKQGEDRDGGLKEEEWLTAKDVESGCG